MQPTTARRFGFAAAVGGAAIYVAVAGKPDHRVATITAISVIFLGLLFTLWIGLRNATRRVLSGVAVVVVLIAVLIAHGPKSSRGLYVSLTQEALVKAADQPTGPLVVFLRVPRSFGPSLPSRLYVNDRETDWRNLRGALLSQLSVRPDWVVFIDADPALPFDDLIRVVDVVNQLSAKPVLLSRKMWQQRSSTSREIQPSRAAWTVRTIADRR
jgi:biopolymer transport protein ExbD